MAVYRWYRDIKVVDDEKKGKKDDLFC